MIEWKTLTISLLTCVVFSCGGRPKIPDYDFEPRPEDCYNLQDKGHPWVVEFPGVDRSSLRADIESGILLVKYDKCGGLTPLPQCVLNAKYGPLLDGGREPDNTLMSSRRDLFLNLPIGFASLKANFQKGRAWRFSNVSVSIRDAPTDLAPTMEDIEALGKTCAGATHYVSRIALGAFFIGSYEAKEGGGRLGVDLSMWKPELGGSAESSKRIEKGSVSNFFVCLDRSTDVQDSRCLSPIRFYLKELPGDSRSPVARQAESRKLEDESKATKEAKRKAEAQPQVKAGVEWIYSKPAGVEFTKTEITLGQYKKCVSVGVCKEDTMVTKSDNKDKHCNLGYSDRDNHPMNCVNWYGADQFCRWLGGGSRLPTENEWYAEASNGSEKREWPWGNSPEVNCDYAIWGDGNGNTNGCGEDTTWPVCSKPRGNSVSGLCDMSGNVSEWTSTDYDSSRKMLRGGSWSFDNGGSLRASSQDWADQSLRGNYVVGFRCVRPSSKPSVTSNHEEIIQPGTNLYWLKCPVGQTWNGSSCIGNAKNMDWKAAKKSCPSGYRLPTKQEFIDLLGGCDSNALEKSLGYCNKCSLSSNCNSMFSSDSLWYWSSSYHGEFVWGANFSSGKLYSFRMGGGDYVRCVR